MSTNDKKKREQELVQQGKDTRERVAHGMVGCEDVGIGGSRPQIQADGSVRVGSVHEDNVMSPPAPSSAADGSDGESRGRGSSKRRRNNRQSDAIEALLGSKSSIQKKRLDFDMERHTKEIEMRRLELASTERRRDQEAAERKREFEFKMAESERSFKLRQQEIEMRQKEMQSVQDRHKQTMDLQIDESQKSHDLKMKKFELMLLQMSNKSN